jgi:TrmH family RNA methyltransferase
MSDAVAQCLRDNVRVLLVGTRHAGNIGAAARALKTMGLRRLELVDPDVVPDAESVRLAAHAADVLASARRHLDLASAIADCTLAVATSARDRRLGPPLLTPREAAPAIVEAARGGGVALVFGREPSGLTNAEVQRCQLQVCVPADPDYGSLNVAMTVQLLAYELRLECLRLDTANAAPGATGVAATDAAALADAASRQRHAGRRRTAQAATQDAVDRLLAHLLATATRVGYLDPRRPRLLAQRLRRLLVRARLEDAEVRLLRGLLASVDAAVPGDLAGAAGDGVGAPPAATGARDRRPPGDT